MTLTLRLLPAAAAGLLLAGCLGGMSSARSNFEETDRQRSGQRAITLDGDELRRGASNLLSALRSRVTGMEVRTSGAGGCPEVMLRGRKSMYGSNDPIIYVDGTRAANTCVLDQLAPGEVRTVEVYPQGITRRPGYEAHPNGLILIFLRDGSEGT
ncbi:MAG TPA: Plug domain-containing protein [Longimicrobium sp.]|nr:Plug domain-containing protein [Longimicrobium sp.]